MLTKGQVDHQTDLLLREVVGNVLVGGRAIFTGPIAPIGSCRLSKRPLNRLHLLRVSTQTRTQWSPQCGL